MSDRLGFTQRAILTSLSNEDRSVGTLSMDWPWISESGARSALNRLYKRGLVEPARWSGREREWSITRRGTELLDQLGAVEDEAETCSGMVPDQASSNV